MFVALQAFLIISVFFVTLERILFWLCLDKFSLQVFFYYKKQSLNVNLTFCVLAMNMLYGLVIIRLVSQKSNVIILSCPDRRKALLLKMSMLRGLPCTWREFWILRLLSIIFLPGRHNLSGLLWCISYCTMSLSKDMCVDIN